ncbi:BTA121 domain-containing protein surface lipoprotein [Borrelia coriaceae]|nr:hypothetical protein [Borrelia coriaceae]
MVLILLLLLILLLISYNFKSSEELVRGLAGKGEVSESGMSKGIRRNSKEDMDYKFNNLLDVFEIFNEDREAVMDMRNIVTSPYIGSGEGINTYTDLEFYDLICALGKFKLRDIIEVYFNDLRARHEDLPEARDAINKIKRASLRETLKRNFNQYEILGYPYYLKLKFNSPIPDIAYYYAMHMGDAYNFGILKNSAKSIVKFESLYS